MIEIRVHGMGDHDYGSALGRPPIVVPRYPDMPDTAEPPPVPPHRVRLINWSRTSRSSLRLLWYLALPFTLVNLMGYMSPAGANNKTRIARVALRAVVVVVGFILTATLQVWLIAIGETIMRPLEFARNAPAIAGDTNVIFVTLLLAAVVLIRWLRGDRILRAEQTPPELEREHAWLGWMSGLSLLTIIGLGALILWLPPTKWSASIPFLRVPTPPDGSAFEAMVERNPGYDYSTLMCLAEKGKLAVPMADRLDPLNAIVILGLLVAVAAWLLLTIVGKATGTLGPLAGASLVAVIAIIALNAVSATFRLGIDWLLTYLDGFRSLGWIEGRAGMSIYERHIVAFQGQRIAACRDELGFIYNSTYYLDSLPMFMVMGGIALVVAFWVVNQRDYVRLKWQHGASGKKRALMFSHVVIANLGTRLATVMLVALPVWMLLGLLSWYLVDVHTGPSSLFWSDVVRVFAQAVAVITVIFVIFGGRLGAIRKALATIADIAGFWDTCYHPLAGDTYRHKVIGGIRSETNAHPPYEPVVLVGHSQGSVVSAWFVARHEHRPLSLLTCGSPLVSLYALYFSTYFGESFRRAVDAGSTRWINTWRETDPIAGPILVLVGKPHDDECLPDPPGRGESHPCGHSDYWIDERQMALVAQMGESEDSLDPTGPPTGI